MIFFKKIFFDKRDGFFKALLPISIDDLIFKEFSYKKAPPSTKAHFEANILGGGTFMDILKKNYIFLRYCPPT
ncbi:MAG: hypothetical protein RL757_506 [Bacteroidota bacterium]|jgi:hypothetical protein